MSGKVGTSENKMVYAKGTFLWWRLCIRSIRTIAYAVVKQNGICRRYLLLQGLCVSSVKTATYVCNRFKMDFFFKFKSKVLKWINPNSLAPTRFLVWKPYLYLTSHTYLTTYLTYHTTSLTDLYFNKKFEQEKKSLYKSISKSIRIDTSQLVFTCSKSTIETLEKSVKYVQSSKKDTTTPMTSFWCFYC